MCPEEGCTQPDPFGRAFRLSARVRPHRSLVWLSYSVHHCRHCERPTSGWGQLWCLVERFNDVLRSVRMPSPYYGHKPQDISGQLGNHLRKSLSVAYRVEIIHPEPLPIIKIQKVYGYMKKSSNINKCCCRFYIDFYVIDEYNVEG